MKKGNEKANAVKLMLSASLEEYILYLKQIALKTA